MGNCFKTQLKESVNNDNLRKIGEIRFSYSNGADVATSFKNCIIDLVNGTATIGTYQDASAHSFPYRITENEAVRIVATSDCIISLTPYYDITDINGQWWVQNKEQIDISKFTYCNINNVTITASASGNKSLVGDIKYLLNPSNYTSTDFVISNFNGLYGDIKQIGKCTSINKTLRIVGSGVSGSIEDYVSSVIFNGGNTSGSLVTSLNPSNQFKANNLVNYLSITLTWAPNAINNTYIDIAYDGEETTIIVDAQGNWSYVNQDKSKYTG